MPDEKRLEIFGEVICQRLEEAGGKYLEEAGKAVLKIRNGERAEVSNLLRRGDDALKKANEKNVSSIREIHRYYAKDSYKRLKGLFEIRGIKYLPFEENPKASALADSFSNEAVKDYLRQTERIGFSSVFGEKGKIAAAPAEIFRELTDYAALKITLGEESYNRAMREVIGKLSEGGMKTVDFSDKTSRSIRSAVKQSTLYKVKECNSRFTEIFGEEVGADGYEVSYHQNPRPSHAFMGGKQFAIGSAKRVKGVFYPSFEETAKPRLEEYGCLHFKFPIILGVSVPAYGGEYLKELKKNDEMKFEFEGTEYTGYEARQLLLKIEREVKKQKNVLSTASVSGDNELYLSAKGRIEELRGKYRKLSEKSQSLSFDEKIRTLPKVFDISFGKAENKIKIAETEQTREYLKNNKAKKHCAMHGVFYMSRIWRDF